MVMRHAKKGCGLFRRVIAATAACGLILECAGCRLHSSEKTALDDTDAANALRYVEQLHGSNNLAHASLDKPDQRTLQDVSAARQLSSGRGVEFQTLTNQEISTLSSLTDSSAEDNLGRLFAVSEISTDTHVILRVMHVSIDELRSAVDSALAVPASGMGPDELLRYVEALSITKHIPELSSDGSSRGIVLDPAQYANADVLPVLAYAVYTSGDSYSKMDESFVKSVSLALGAFSAENVSGSDVQSRIVRQSAATLGNYLPASRRPTKVVADVASSDIKRLHSVTPYQLMSLKVVGLPDDSLNAVVRQQRDRITAFSSLSEHTQQIILATGRGTVLSSFLAMRYLMSFDIKAKQFPSWLAKGINAVLADNSTLAKSEETEIAAAFLSCDMLGTLCVHRTEAVKALSSLLPRTSDAEKRRTEAFKHSGILAEAWLDSGVVQPAENQCPVEDAETVLAEDPELVYQISRSSNICASAMTVGWKILERRISHALDQGSYLDAVGAMKVMSFDYQTSSSFNDMVSSVQSAMSAHERSVAKKLGANWLSQKRPLAYEYCKAMERMWMQ